MRPRATVLLFLATLTASCEPPSPPPPTPPGPGRIEEPAGGITVEAEGLPPEAKQAVAEFTRGLLADAIGKAIRDGVEDLYRKLKITDEVEKRLLGGRYEWGSPDEENDTWSIYLVRPGDAARPPETIELSRDGRPVIRLTRALGGVERPIAVMTRSRVVEGEVTQAELFLTCGPDGKWQAQRPKVSREVLGIGGR